MGQLRTATAHDIMSFPGATFAVVGSVPLIQCTTSVYAGTTGATFIGTGTFETPNTITSPNPVLKELVIISPPSVAGTYNIIDFFSRFFTTDAVFAATESNVSYYVQDPAVSPLQAADGLILIGNPNIEKVGFFLNWELSGLKVTVTAPPVDVGTYNILSNTGNFIVTDHLFAVAGPFCAFSCFNDEIITTTQTIMTFAEFLADLGQPYTIKGGVLYTSALDPPISSACPIVWNPA